MSRTLFALVVSLATLGTSRVQAQSIEETAALLREKNLSSAISMQIVTDLTTLFGPRLAGSDSEKRSATWIKTELETLGFDKVWIEPFQIDGWMRGQETAEITGANPQKLMVTALGRSVATPPQGIEAGIVLFKRYQDLLDAPVGSLKGKIALVTQPTVRAQDGAGYGYTGPIRRAGPSEAAKRGAVAYLMRSLGTEEHRFPHTGNTTYDSKITRIPAAALSAPDVEQIERLAAKGQSVRIKLTLTPRDLGKVTSQNVIAEIRGREKPDEIILISGHLDSWDLGTGALDDGAGVAIAIGAGKSILDLPQRPRRTIRVVLFGSEEVGLLGGKAYHDAHKEELSKHILVTEADFGQGPVYKFSTRIANPNHPSINRIQNALTPLGIVRGDNEAEGGSDVSVLVAANVPAVSLELDGNDYFDYHHTPDDTLDKIDPKRLNQATAANAVFAYMAAELEGDYRPEAAAVTK